MLSLHYVLYLLAILSYESASMALYINAHRKGFVFFLTRSPFSLSMLF